MADGKKKGRGGKLLLVTLLAVIGLGVAGYMKPDLPLVGPLVTKFFKSGAEGVDKSGLYQVRVTQAAVSPEEFSEGENVDLQVSIERLDADGDATRIWQSWQYGARRAKVGKDSITATWSDRPVEIAWQPGERFVVKLWDLAGIGSTVLGEWQTDAESKVFPLSGTHTFERVKGKIARVKGATQIVFEAKHVGDYPVEQ